MPRARSKKRTVSAGGITRPRLWRAAKGRYEEKVVHDTGTGGAVSSLEDPPKLENPTSRQTELLYKVHVEFPLKSDSTQTPPLPKEPDSSKMGSQFSSILMPLVVPSGLPTLLVQCERCPPTPLCEKCLFPCPGIICTNQSCPVVSLLLTCDLDENSASRVRGCPVFRACPKCHNIMMYDKGCKYVTCTNCKHAYCFICLRTRNECTKDGKYYWSLTCSAPRAARQRFQT